MRVMTVGAMNTLVCSASRPIVLRVSTQPQQVDLRNIMSWRCTASSKTGSECKDRLITNLQLAALAINISKKKVQI